MKKKINLHNVLSQILPLFFLHSFFVAFTGSIIFLPSINHLASQTFNYSYLYPSLSSSSLQWHNLSLFYPLNHIQNEQREPNNRIYCRHGSQDLHHYRVNISQRADDVFGQPKQSIIVSISELAHYNNQRR